MEEDEELCEAFHRRRVGDIVYATLYDVSRDVDRSSATDYGRIHLC